MTEDIHEDEYSSRQNVELVYRRLRDAILKGDIPAEVPLSQVQLSQQFGVSRTPLREALRLLQREGLIDAEINRRVRVTGLSISDLEQIYASRITLEALAVRLTVPKLTDEELSQLEAYVEGIETYSKSADYERWLVPHRAFHSGIIAHAGDRISAQIQQLFDHAERYRRVYTLETPGAWTAGVEEHRSILEACLERDAGAAAERLIRHYTHVALAVIARIAPEYEPTVVRTALRMMIHSSK